MAVQIIDPNPDPSTIRTCICTCCGVKLSFTEVDTYRDYKSDYLGDKDWYTYISCPNCSHKNVVGDWR